MNEFNLDINATKEDVRNHADVHHKARDSVQQNDQTKKVEGDAAKKEHFCRGKEMFHKSLTMTLT